MRFAADPTTSYLYTTTTSTSSSFIHTLLSMSLFAMCVLCSKIFARIFFFADLNFRFQKHKLGNKNKSKDKCQRQIGLLPNAAWLLAVVRHALHSPCHAMRQSWCLINESRFRLMMNRCSALNLGLTHTRGHDVRHCECQGGIPKK